MKTHFQAALAQLGILDGPDSSSIGVGALRFLLLALTCWVSEPDASLTELSEQETGG